MGDYKYKIQKIAEEIAAKEYEEALENLPQEVQDAIWGRAETQYQEGLRDQADNLRKESELHELGVVSKDKQESQS